MKKKRNVVGYILAFIAAVLLLVVLLFLRSAYGIIESAKEEGNGAVILAIIIPLVFMIIFGIAAIVVSIPSFSILGACIKDVPKGRKIVNIVIISLLGILFIATAVAVIVFFVTSSK